LFIVRDEHGLRAFQNDADKKFWTKEGGNNVRMTATAQGRANNLYSSPGIIRVAFLGGRIVQDGVQMRNAHTRKFWSENLKDTTLLIYRNVGRLY
jgi:ribosomal protein L28